MAGLDDLNLELLAQEEEQAGGLPIGQAGQQSPQKRRQPGLAPVVPATAQTKDADAQLEEYWKSQLEKVRSRESGWRGVFDALEDTRSKYSAPPGMDYQTNRLKELDARAGLQKEALTGLQGLANTRALQAQRSNVTSLYQMANEAQAKGDIPTAQMLRQRASLMDPNYAQVMNQMNLPTSNYGKQAADEGLVRGTPAFAARVKELQEADAANKSTQAQAQMISAQAKTAENKPLSATQQKAVNTHLDDAQLADRNVSELKRLKETVLGAGWWQTGLAGRATAWTGVGKAAEIESQISALAPKQRPPGSGSTSNYDAEQYKKAIGGGLSKDELLRSIDAGMALHANDAQYNTYMAQVQENRGNQSEARKLWNEYSKANPIFDKNGKVNPNRKTLEQWQQEGGGAAAASAAPTAGGTSKPPAASQPPAGIVAGTSKTINGVTYEFDGKGWKEKKNAV